MRELTRAATALHSAGTEGKGMEKEQLTLELETMLSVPSSKLLKIKPSHLRLIDAGEKITEEEPDSQDKAFTTRYLVQATLPYRCPKDNPPFWYRVNGNYTLTIQPGMRTNHKTGVPESTGYPFGSVPRLLLFWLTTEAVRTGKRKLTPGNSLAEFVKEIGLNPDNGSTGAKRSDKRRLHDQMERLFRAKISFDYHAPGMKSWLDMQIAPKAALWWDFKNPDQLPLYESWIELGEDFFNAITHSSFPVDMRALKALKNSPLALDLYAWCTYKTYLVSKSRKPQRVSWRQLQEQFGTENEHVKSFKQTAKYALRKISVVYPGLNLDEIDGGLIINPGATAIPSRPKPAIGG
jgi:hypothetical protein